MKKKATFSREQLSKSKTFGYGKDLVLAVLEDRDYTKDEAEKEIQAYFPSLSPVNKLYLFG